RDDAPDLRRREVRHRETGHRKPPRACHRATGSEKWNIEPYGAFGVAHIAPPCASTIERQIDNPMPLPPGFVVKNALNNSTRWSAAMPMPVSCTLISTSSSLSGQERIASSRGRSETEAIAWTAFITVEDDLLELHAVAAHRR